MSDAACSVFNSGRRNDLNRSDYLTVKYHNPEKVILQHLPVEEKTDNQ